MDLLQPIIKNYAWGSRTALARIQGRSTPSSNPEAELWMGAHPAGPARVTRGGETVTLQDVVAGRPERELGVDTAARFGGRLPFLLKILAAEQPLSIQVHPDRNRARDAFAAQLAGTGSGPYSDDWPKPELLCALTPFEVLAGFRTREEAARVLDGLALPALRPVTSLLEADSGAAAMTTALRALLEWPERTRGRLVDEVVRACARLARQAGPYAAPYEAVTRMAHHHPGDIGLVASLLLRHQVVEPGAALFMPAGGLHAYVRGVGVEVMAASDNVLRAGLTSKEIDVPELLRITDPSVRVAAVRPRLLPGPGTTHSYDCPAEEFALHRIALSASPTPLTPASGPRVALCLDGSALLSGPAGDTLTLGPGASCFVPDSDEGVTVQGTGTLFVASAGSLRSTQAHP
ncbi:mannose-6-phosphate isomerase, class I [Streptomyces sp. NPDC014006]|uniref:mannose-6-phosphate isomerase, class I n=1 Tax=Streptomyces sp. NPDC014006 TaxID=3364870 RepID=UPI0037031B2A